jgi:hypothetical protein
MFNTKPEQWVVVKIENPKEKDPFLRTVHKVFASWAGCYTAVDSWKMNSGIDRIMEDESTVKFYGYSGSCYECKKGSYGTGFSYTAGILDNFINKAKDMGARITILPEDTNWMEL